MVAYAIAPKVSPTEYLELERAAETRSEYYNGIIVAMAGSSLEHDRITGSIHGSLYAQLKGQSCEPLTGNMRVLVPDCKCYFYPDVTVACPDLEIERVAGVQSVVNPVLIVEVLSGSTEKTDREYKLICYQTLPSLRIYAIVAQDKPLFQVFERQPGGDWIYTHFQGLEATVSFKSIGCELALAEVYARIEFEADNSSDVMRIMEERALYDERSVGGTEHNANP